MNLNNISKLEIMSIKTFLIMVLMGFAGMNIQAQEKFSSEELDTMIVELKKIFHQQQMYEKSIDLQFPLKKLSNLSWEEGGLRNIFRYFDQVDLRVNHDFNCIDVQMDGVVSELPDFWHEEEILKTLKENSEYKVVEVSVMCEKIFGRVKPKFVFHLTDSLGRTATVETPDKIYSEWKSRSDGRYEVLLRFEFIPEERVKNINGYIELHIPEPERYDRIYVSSSDTSQLFHLGDVPFQLKKADRESITIGCAYSDRDFFNGCHIICCHNGEYYSVLNYNQWGDTHVPTNLTTCAAGKTFEEWIAMQGIDPEHLKEFMQQGKQGQVPANIELQWKLNEAPEYDGFWIFRTEKNEKCSSALSVRMSMDGTQKEITVSPRFLPVWNSVRGESVAGGKP